MAPTEMKNSSKFWKKTSPINITFTVILIQITKWIFNHLQQPYMWRDDRKIVHSFCFYFDAKTAAWGKFVNYIWKLLFRNGCIVLVSQLYDRFVTLKFENFCTLTNETSGQNRINLYKFNKVYAQKNTYIHWEMFLTTYH